MALLYRITIYYREPSYEERCGSGARVFNGSFEVEAEDRYHAMDVARRRFDWIATQSTAEWVREIVGYQCEVVTLH